MKSHRFCTALAAAILFASCSAEQHISRDVKKTFKNSALIRQYRVGFALYDPESKKMLYQQDADRYYTPASNTKLYTFYAGLKILKDSVPSLRYIEQGDSLIFWGTGDPSFLHSQLKNRKALDFLAGSPKKLFYAPGRYTGSFYATGWAWDDYNDYYQAELNELPVMDNLVAVRKSPTGGLLVSPRLFTSCFEKNPEKKGDFSIQRAYLENRFEYPDTLVPDKFEQQIPYKVSETLTLNLLSDTLNRPVHILPRSMPSYARTIFGAHRDSVLKQMMLPSDNFIAEQLLLVYADQAGLELNTGKAIAHITKTYLAGLPDKPQWADGSGLSRMNLFTPRDMIYLLDLIWQEFPDKQKLYDLLPAGGKSGTLRNAYAKTDQPFVFGKTGTLSNIHNQSGYIRTRKGKTLFFAFMNNNFLQPTAEVRKEMVRIMTGIHDNY
ncbi:D-alanyl-D-alanine carboxypeptidase/D-alanyl-D-alanine-endopeptidase [Pedobacter sp. SYP-B3415]|uniref:D-alanyl-D-alanine carboxypeptidase/D-alanyl-D-alanine-endopeptidase n=1 Tax=Pedobacter sp. SYP-B3415 TaxID=2496641 RepID=UPI00101D605F|nr:D-alanyl-D-alanine carboxypeptidase [Pedobacter sp. SYP-B3415]